MLSELHNLDVVATGVFAFDEMYSMFQFLNKDMQISLFIC